MNTAGSKAIIVLGMHRSGTSAMGGVLERLGIDFGRKLMPAMDGVNDKGFYEHTGIVELHEQLLAVLGYHWSDVRPFPPEWWKRTEIAPIKQKLLTLLRNDFGASPFWGLKDPRMCRLMPLWLELFQKLDVDPYFIYMFRHPSEVVTSLQKRDGLDANGAYILWLWHLLESEHHTRGLPRIFVAYEELLRDWQSAVRPESLNLEWPVSPGEANKDIEAFLDTGLRHNRVEGKVDLEGVAGLALTLYSHLQQGDLTCCNTVSESFQLEIEKLKPYLGSINRIQLLSESDTHCQRALVAEKQNATEQIEYRDALITELQERNDRQQECIDRQQERIDRQQERIDRQQERIDRQRMLLGSRMSLLKLLLKPQAT